MGSYIAMSRLGMQIGLLDPHTIVSVQAKKVTEII